MDVCLVEWVYLTLVLVSTVYPLPILFTDVI